MEIPDPSAGNRITASQDDAQVQLTKLQAQKCAAIVSAYADGHARWREGALTVSAFLFAISMESLGGAEIIRPGAQHYWNELDNMPWPTSGRPNPPPAVAR